MIAVDTNLLVYAHREEMPAHRRSREVLESLVTRGEPWALPYPCVHEFLAIVTRASLWEVPTQVGEAVAAMGELLDQPDVHVLGEARDHWERLCALLAPGHVHGPRVHDARIAAICLSHGVGELWSADRDFGAFPALRVRNPLVPP